MILLACREEALLFWLWNVATAADALDVFVVVMVPWTIKS